MIQLLVSQEKAEIIGPKKIKDKNLFYVLKEEYRHQPAGILLKVADSDRCYQAVFGCYINSKYLDNCLWIYLNKNISNIYYRLGKKSKKTRSPVGHVGPINSFCISATCYANFYNLISEKEKFKSDVEDEVIKAVRYYNKKLAKPGVKKNIRNLNRTINYIKSGEKVFFRSLEHTLHDEFFNPN